jgi:quercetin dioxygenase-like cupin family protein
VARNEAKAQWDAFGKIPSFSPVTGIHMRSLTGDQIMLNMVTIEPGAVVPIHNHDNEQAGYVVRGELILTIGDETRTLVPGDCYVAPASIPHGATSGPEGCDVLDVFSPPRADYADEAAKARSASSR